MPSENPRPGYAALLLDCDGVLVDSTALADQALRIWASQNSLNPDRVLQSSRGMRIPEVMNHLVPDRAEQERHRLQQLEISMAAETKSCPGALELIEAINGRAPWAIVTSADRELAKARLEAAGLPEPAVLVAAEDVRNGKPAPDCYLRAAQTLGVSASSCLAIDDLGVGVQAATAAGAQALHLRTDAKTCQPHVIRSLRELDVSVRGGRIHVAYRI